MQKVERMHKNVSHWPHSLFITIQSTYFHLPTSSPMPCECSRLIFNDLRHPTYSITGSSSHNRWIWPNQKRQYLNQRTRSRHAICSKLQYVVVPTYSSKCNVSFHQISIRAPSLLWRECGKVIGRQQSDTSLRDHFLHTYLNILQ